MGEFKFKDTVENLKTNLLDNLGRWVPTAIAEMALLMGLLHIFCLLPEAVIQNRFN